MDKTLLRRFLKLSIFEMNKMSVADRIFLAITFTLYVAGSVLLCLVDVRLLAAYLLLDVMYAVEHARREILRKKHEKKQDDALASLSALVLTIAPIVIPEILKEQKDEDRKES